VCDHKHILAYEQLHINREKAINSNKSFKVANPEYEAQLKKRFVKYMDVNAADRIV